MCAVQQLRILIASRRAAERSPMKMFLQKEARLDVVAEAADAHELLALAKVREPDVVLLDRDLSDGPLEDLIGALRLLDCQPGVIVLGLSSGTERAALAAGADAFVLKGDPPKRLLIAIEAVRLGRDHEL